MKIIWQRPANLVQSFAELMKKEPEKVNTFLEDENGLGWIEKHIMDSGNKKACLGLSGIKLFIDSYNFNKQRQPLNKSN